MLTYKLVETVCIQRVYVSLLTDFGKGRKIRKERKKEKEKEKKKKEKKEKRKKRRNKESKEIWFSGII